MQVDPDENAITHHIWRMRKQTYVRFHGSISSGGRRALFDIPRRKELVLASLPTSHRILDAGSGPGMIAEVFQAGGHQVICTELNETMAREAMARGLSVVQCDLEEPLPFADGSFDVVHAGEVIEHLFDTLGFLKECHRVLRTGGLVFFTTPNVNSLLNRVRCVSGHALPFWGAFPGDFHGDHIRVLNLEKAWHLCELARFRVDRVIGICTVYGPLNRLIQIRPSLSDMLMIRAVRL